VPGKKDRQRAMYEELRAIRMNKKEGARRKYFSILKRTNSI
jgi:hypothetical protein